MSPFSRAFVLRAATASAAAAATGIPAFAQGTLTPLKVGAYPTDTFCEAYYAADKGFYKDAGFDVEITSLASGTALAAAALSGALQVAVTNGLAVASAHLRNVPLVFVASAGLYNPAATQLLVAESGAIKSARDLDGKIVSVSSVKGAEALGLLAWIDRNGGDSTKVKLTEIAPSEMPAAVLRGTIAAGVITEPNLSAAHALGGLRPIGAPFDSFGTRFLLGGWCANANWVKSNPAVVKRFVDVTYATARWANAHHDESAVILAKYAKLSPDVLRTMARSPYGESLVPTMLQPIYDLAVKYKMLDGAVDANNVIAKV
jgi:NitT/TauT family transport system substrate-binding protein